MPPTPHFFGFCWKIKVLSVESMAGFGIFILEAKWRYIDFDPFYTVSYGKCLTIVPPEIKLQVILIEDLKAAQYAHSTESSLSQTTLIQHQLQEQFLSPRD